MIILIAIVSVYAFTGLTYLVRRKFSVNICPICVGVSITWIWMLFGMTLRVIPDSFMFPAGILVGMSILGIANKLGKKQYKFWRSPETGDNSKIEELNEKMKNCC
ncbi:MAG: hypothetical protein Q8O46_03800 [bacterium]|nr:hypothetical protein [bacterium]